MLEAIKQTDDERPATSQLFDNERWRWELATQALLRASLLHHCIGSRSRIIGRLLKGNGTLPRLRRCLHSGARNNTPQQHHHHQKRSVHN